MPFRFRILFIINLPAKLLALIMIFKGFVHTFVGDQKGPCMLVRNELHFGSTFLGVTNNFALQMDLEFIIYKKSIGILLFTCVAQSSYALAAHRK